VDNIDNGLQRIGLNGDGSTDIVVDWGYVACGAAGGGGCSNRGCDLEIFKQAGPAAWKKIFSEHVTQHFLSVTYKGRFRVLIVQLAESTPQRKAEPTPETPGALDVRCFSILATRAQISNTFALMSEIGAQT
jgi:hypothetical protein